MLLVPCTVVSMLYSMLIQEVLIGFGTYCASAAFRPSSDCERKPHGQYAVIALMSQEVNDDSDHLLNRSTILARAA